RAALLQRQQERAPGGSRPVRVGLAIEGRRAAREGAAVFHTGQRIGRGTSGTVTPTLNRPTAMAAVIQAGAPVGTTPRVEVGKERAPCRVVPLPFYKRAA